LFHVIFQVNTEDLEKRVEELKKEYDHSKKKSKGGDIVQVEEMDMVESPSPPSNGIIDYVPRNISPAISNK